MLGGGNLKLVPSPQVAIIELVHLVQGRSYALLKFNNPAFKVGLGNFNLPVNPVPVQKRQADADYSRGNGHIEGRTHLG